MPEHGDYDPQAHNWHCGYWMTEQEWLDIHDYAPPTLQEDKQEEEDEEE